LVGGGEEAVQVFVFDWVGCGGGYLEEYLFKFGGGEGFEVSVEGVG